MSDIAIRVENLGKRYRLGETQHYKTLRESLVSAGRRLLRRPANAASGNGDAKDFWALKDVSFEVKAGEVIGIIGRNGAGKSTLLKILSRITEPTTGRAELTGRVGSLLEVGTGFHPELTGRENIFLNGAILGMTRAEIKSKFDEIVGFSEIEKFLDTPVKRYSSGMYVRLAFAVAAHLEPEILVVDEVLAVGDAGFQAKCIGKMSSVAHEGRTIVFVSHDMGAIEALCSRAVVLSNGALVVSAPVTDAIGRYLSSRGSQSATGYYAVPPTRDGGKAAIREAIVTSGGHYSPHGYPVGTPLEFCVRCLTEVRDPGPQLGIGIDNERGVRVCTLHTRLDSTISGTGVGPGEFKLRCSTSDLALPPGRYHLKLSYNGVYKSDVVIDALVLEILPSGSFNSGHRGLAGTVWCRQSWVVQRSPQPEPLLNPEAPAGDCL